jgi:hypothetical protein
MHHPNGTLADLLASLDLGTPVAETDRLLEVARVETSAFRDLLNDRVDLIPGTKGSGKSALFRIFVGFLPDVLLTARRVVVAHGVEDPGDPVFDAFRDEFERLDEKEFVAFWCIYLVSLAQEQFVKGPRYAALLKSATKEVGEFQAACAAARIPEVRARKSLRSILEWTLAALKNWRPKLTYRLPHEQGELELGMERAPVEGEREPEADEHQTELPRYLASVRRTLEGVLNKCGLSIWLMVDRLDEIFPRRSDLERTALRGLLRAMRMLSSEVIRVKVFLRDDMLEHVVEGKEGFVALTHITARQADTLRWTEDQILAMICKRIFANPGIRSYLSVDAERLEASASYRKEAFYKVFPPQIHLRGKQSPTLTWIYNRCVDGRGVVTPRDVLDLLIRAKQRQQDICRGDAAGVSDWMIGPAAVQYGLEELSKRKRTTYLQAEFPHLWPEIEKLIGGKAEYGQNALRATFGPDWSRVATDLASIGLFASRTRRGQPVYVVPYLYRKCLEITQGQA